MPSAEALTGSEEAPSRLGVASVLAAASQLLSLAIGLWATPRLVHGLGDASYAVLAIVVSFTAYFAYLELGLGGAFIRALAAAHTLRDYAHGQRLLETAQAIYLRVAVAGAAGMIVIGWPYLTHAVQEPTLRAQAHWSLIVIAVTFAGTMALSATRAVMVSAQRTDLYLRVVIVIQPLIPIVQVLFIRWGFGLIAVLIVQAVGTLAIDLIVFAMATRLMPALKLRARFDRQTWLELRGFSLFKFGSQLAQQGQASGDRLLLGELLPIARVAPYAIASSIGRNLRGVVGAVAAPFYAAATERFATDGARGLEALSELFFRRVTFLLALGSGGAIFLAAPFLRSWMGEAYAQAGSDVLQLIVLASSLSLLATLSGQATDAAGIPRASMVASIGGLAVSVGSTLVLVPFLGAVGAAYGFLGGAAVQLVWNGAALVALVGRAAPLISVGVVKPALITVATYLAMRFVPHGERLPGCIGSMVVGTAVGTTFGVLIGMARAEDLPRRFRRRLEVQERA
jgi:O-antigen/teichoic acid export membrane protein